MSILLQPVDILQTVDVLLLFMRRSIFTCKHTSCINARSYGYQIPVAMHLLH